MLGKLLLGLFLVLGIAMAVPSTRSTLIEKASPVLNGFRAKMVPSRLDAMADQLEERMRRGEGFPNSWENWLDRDFTGDPKDPWGNVFYLQPSRRSFTVGSMGPDGVKGNEDDIKLTRQLGG